MKKISFNELQNILADENNKNKLYFVEFTTTWCGDCKMMAPIVNSLNADYQDKENIEFLEVDAEEANVFRDPNSKYKVLRVPTHLVIKDNKILRSGYEYYPKEILSDWIEEFYE